METLNVRLFVFDTMADWETGFATAWLNNPLFQKAPGRFKVSTVGRDKREISTIGGLRIAPDFSLDEVSPENCAMLILPGGLTWDEGKNPEAVEKAAEMLSAGRSVAAICAATAAIARRGLLDSRRHTSNSKEYLAATGYKGAALYDESLAVRDKSVITASGVAPVDFAKRIFEELDVYSESVLAAWFHLFKSGDPKYFGGLLQAAGMTHFEPSPSNQS